MSVTEDDVKKWFCVAKKWERADSPDTCEGTFESLQELLSFLLELQICLEQLSGNPQLILQTFPSVGKLLGQLYENCVILASAEVFQAVVRCSVTLSHSSGSFKEKNISKKAKSWVETQLRRASVPVLKYNNLQQFGEFLNFTAQETLETVLDKLVFSLCHDLDMISSYSWHSVERKCFPQKPVSGFCLRQLSELCLPLITIPKAKPLVEKILCCEKSMDLLSSFGKDNAFSVTDSISPVFLRAVASNKGLMLSDQARVSLWKQWRTSFEYELLDLIEICTLQRPYMTQLQLRNIISSKKLTHLCVENPEFFALSMNLFSAVFVRSVGSCQAAKLMSIFGQMCVEACMTGNQKMVMKFGDLFPYCSQPLMKRLSLNPHELKSQEFLQHTLQEISHDLEELQKKSSKSATFSLWQMLWCFPSWEREVIRLSLSSCDKKVLDACCTVFCWYHCPPLSDDNMPLKESLCDILHSLRLLKSKTQLRSADVEYILSSCQALPFARTASLLSNLLVSFVLEAVGGHFVFGDVLRWLTPGFSTIKRLSFMLDSFENIFSQRKSLIGVSGDLKNVRYSLAGEIAELLDTAQHELRAQCGLVVIDSIKPSVVELNSVSKDLVERTEQLVRVLKT